MLIYHKKATYMITITNINACCQLKVHIACFYVHVQKPYFILVDKLLVVVFQNGCMPPTQSGKIPIVGSF